MIVDDDASVAIENFAAGCHNRQRFDAVPLGAFVINFRAFNLQFPKAGDQKKENSDSSILECCHLGGRKTGIVPKLDLAGVAGLVDLVFEGREAHKSAEAVSRLAKSAVRLLR